MNYLPKFPFMGSRNNQLEKEDSLTKIRIQTQHARQNLQEAMGDNDDDDSVNLILRDSGIEKPAKSKFNYDEADKRIRQRELDARKRREEMNKRLRLKELQLFPNLKNELRDNSFNLDDSIDATMRKHDLKKPSSAPESKFTLIPSPLPASPPDNIKLWKQKLKETKYELPSQEEQRLQREWDDKRKTAKELRELESEKEGLNKNEEHLQNLERQKTYSRKNQQKDDTHEVLLKADKGHTSFEDDEFHSFSLSPQKDSEIQKLLRQVRHLQDQNEILTSEKNALEKEKNYWKHEANIMSLENEELSKSKHEMNMKLRKVLDENKLLYQYCDSKLDKKKHYQEEPNYKNSVTESPKMDLDLDDTTQLIKYASDSYKTGF